ncbi:MAG: peptidylprolyl isomerase [Acidimicrobiia bacterium]|nr:peptidylprolyl isomerase [Acidimicrobiia bacterium]
MDGDVVEVHYVLTLDDGTVVQSSRDSMPLSFTVGSGQVITGFDDAVRGRSVGEVVDVTIAPEEAYGERDETLTTEVPVAPSQGDVAVGDTVYLSNGQPVVVLEVADDVATVDLNHPLAGETLHFEIEVLAITRG